MLDDNSSTETYEIISQQKKNESKKKKSKKTVKINEKIEQLA